MKEKKSSGLFLFFIYILPKNLFSRITGYVAAAKLPKFILRPFMAWFIRKYNVNVDEAEHPPEHYASLNLFFTRRLKEGVRPIDSKPGILVSPVDGAVSEFGDIVDGRLIQAKGLEYTLDGLLDCPEHVEKYRGGKYLVIYLSPPDYHRIHTPCAGRVLAYSYAPGKLFPVNEAAVHGIRNLFPRNERLTTYVENKSGNVALVKVGATNVGKISVVYDDIITNGWIRRRHLRQYENEIKVERGDELARFNMGSTVVLVFEKDKVDILPEVVSGRKIRLGEPIAKFK